VAGPVRARTVIASAFVFAAFASTTGIVESTLFDQPSLRKYLLTVLGCLFAALLVIVADPARLLTAVLVFALPFSGYKTTFGGVQVTLLTLLAALALAALAFTRPAAWRPTRMAAWSVVALLLLVVPFALGQHRSEPLKALATMLAIGWLVAAVGRGGGARLLAGAFVASATLQSLIAVWEYKTGHLISVYGSAGTRSFDQNYFFNVDHVNRPVGTFFDPNSLGNMLAVALPFALWLAMRPNARRGERLLAGAAGCVVAAGLVLTLSRMSWIAAAAGVLIAAALLPRRHRARALIGVATIATVTLLVASATAGPTLVHRAQSILSPTSRQTATAQGDELRKHIWSATYAVWREQPLLGTGFGELTPALVRRRPEITLQGHAHSVYLGVLGQAGIVGAIALLTFLGASLRAGLAGRRRDPLLAGAVLGAFVAVLVVWTTDYTIRYEPVAGVFGVVFGFLAALDRSPALGRPSPALGRLPVASAPA
jgi:O-antigen ligase